MRTPLKVIAATLTASAGLALTSAPTAHAGPIDCASGRVCMWEDPGMSGDMYVNWAPSGWGAKYNIDGWNGDNEISSVWNRTGFYVRIYDNDDYTGTSICIKPGAEVNVLGDRPWYFDNEAESAKTVTGC